MKFSTLDQQHSDEVISLFYSTFRDSEGVEEAKSVSGLVERYFLDFPREDLLAYGVEINNEIVAAVFFSELKFHENDSKCLVYLLSPMAVKTIYQGKGIGQKLIKFAHEELRIKGVNLCMTYGDVQFYSKLGYQQIDIAKIKAPYPLTYPEGWLAFQLDGKSVLELNGVSECIPELRDESLW